MLSVEDFVATHLENLQDRIRPQDETANILFHGHCHQKAAWGQHGMSELLQKCAGGRGMILPTGCCGMAGAFGYGFHRYETSKAIFAAPEFDPVREAKPADVIVASGTSCRGQIHHFTRRYAVHPVEWLENITRATSQSPSRIDL